MFSEDDKVAALAAMREALPGPMGPAPAPAQYGVRWTDVDAAVRWGSGVSEMAVYTATRVSDDQWVFQIYSVADEPVTLTVSREAPPRIYSARAVAGIFGDRQDLVDRLLRELDLAMRAFGAKPMPVALDEQ